MLSAQNASIRLKMIINTHQAVEHLLSGGILIYPTDTVYGLGCLPSQEKALNTLLTLKNRNRQFIVITPNWDTHRSWLNEEVSHDQLSTSNPTTWLFNASNTVPETLLSPNGMIAMRIVSHIPTKRLLEKLPEPLVSTSANLPGSPPIKTYKELQETFNFPVMSGKNGGKEPSTIIRYRDKKIIRP